MQTLHSLSAALILSMLAACSSSEFEPIERTQQPLAVVTTDDGGVSARAVIEQQLSRSSANLRFVERPEGVRQVRIMGGFQHATIVVRAADGGLARQCVSDVRQARELLGEAAP